MSFVRKIMRVGDSDVLVLPPQLMRGLLWERGDYILIHLSKESHVVLTKFELPELTDEIILMAERLPQIKYD
ncbi:MAG: hypothetical protein MN733_02405 [Nitrososphaera sp.]|nr:hypothetical protein [Nitrososphaera sp.]